MTIKKIFITTSSFIITAFLLSQVYSFKNTQEKVNTINYSAFVNLAENIKFISSSDNTASNIENSMNTADIIQVIEREISGKVYNTRYSMREIRLPVKEIQKIKNAKIEMPGNKITPIVKMKVEDLSRYEINNSGLVNLYAMNTERLAVVKFKAPQLKETNIAQNKKIEPMIKDEVIVSQASLVKVLKEAKTAVVSEVTEEPTATNEEMVMFDYADKPEAPVAKKTIDQKLYERPISQAVQQAISREVGSTPKKVNPKEIGPSVAEIENQQIDLEHKDNIIYDYSPKETILKKNPAQSKSGKSEKSVDEEIDAFTAPKETLRSRFILRAKEINLNTQKRRQAYSFEFVPDYERGERTDDQESGEIAFEYSLVNSLNTQTGVVQAKGMINTRIELDLSGNALYEIPLINEDGIQTFLQKKGLSVKGNLILMAIDQSITDTEIDSKFDQKFFFNKNFKMVSSAVSASYVMYAGVKTGNVMIRYLLANKESSQKVVFVGDGEVYFEDASFTTGERETYTLTTRNILGNKKKELSIDGNDITYFNTNISAKKKALNAYDIKIPAQASGMRKYLEFKHLKDVIMVGTSEEKNIEIPGNDFIGKVLEVNKVNSLKESCVVQINLSKDLRDIKANGKNSSGEMLVETTYLDNDGGFSSDSAEMSEKVFLIGDQEGQFNIKLDYTDGSTQFLKTFCSEGTYLVEQL